ncbi:hypothetical protein DMB38_05085 [Streptomyces sp. WAC 06738]|uniref:hypothetical protein n=1 Tax=Streptomyces sp. WAC 06738 TaxID=2203210 RepID=UPI000F6FA55E|nr:hypothetical protein [Streptomyces sp. WAC 06738]AZM45285.1 hypothetical protein DMB38_05085 [Streptomyces sp. WAC 06738]
MNTHHDDEERLVPRMLEVSDAVRAEIGDEEADRLVAGESAPGTYDCTSCRAPGDSAQEQTSTVLFVGEETAVLAFAHATCIPSQVVPVSEDQLQGAVRSITADEGPAPAHAPAPAPVEAHAPAALAPAVSPAPPVPVPADAAASPAAVAPPAAPEAPAAPAASGGDHAEAQAVLGVTCGLVMCGEDARPALVVEPTAPVVRPGSEGPGDDFLPLLIESGFLPVMDMVKPPAPVTGWSVLLVAGHLHAVMQPGTAGQPPTAWWQAHQPLHVSDGWRAAAAKEQEVLVYAAPAGAIGRQPREDLLGEALAQAAARGLLVGAAMPLTGT